MMKAEDGSEEALLPTAAPAPSGVDSTSTAQASTPSKHRRLESLDIQRGLTIAIMILVDDYKSDRVNHSPWHGVTLADVVMPWFLFMVGTSMAFSFKKFRGGKDARKRGTRVAALRSLKLYALGILLDGGGWIEHYGYGYNLRTMRFCGILQRIAWGYFIVALLELWAPVLDIPPESLPPSQSWVLQHVAVMRRHAWKWGGALGTVALHLALLFGTYVPSWKATIDADSGKDDPCPPGYTFGNNSCYAMIECNVRGQLTPACSAEGFYDRAIFGQQRCAVWESGRLPVCQGKEQDRPAWCYANVYDPEGALSTIPAVFSVWIGLHFGHLVAAQNTRARTLTHWSAATLVLITLGLGMSAGHTHGGQGPASPGGLPMNKQLWTFSYALFMAGTCGLCLCAWYFLVDRELSQHDTAGARSRRRASWLLAPLRYMGMNAILVFFWHGTATTLLNAVYWQGSGSSDTKYALIGDGHKGSKFVSGFRDRVVCAAIHDHDGVMSKDSPCQLVFVLVRILCFCLATYMCARAGYFWKL